MDAKATTDGRTQRSVRSRARLVDALIALLEQGHLRPTGQQVADQAGMNLRTVFRHFEDMETLYAAIQERIQETVLPGLLEKRAMGSLHERIQAMVRVRSRAFERVAPFQRAERLDRWSSPLLQRGHAEFAKGLKRDLRERLPEVTGLPAPICDAIEQLTSFEAWDRLRDEQGLGVRRAEAAVEAGLRRLFAR